MTMAPSAGDAVAKLRADRSAVHAWGALATPVLLGLLAVLSGWSRLYTVNDLTGGPSPDEYLYAVHARDLARAWASGASFSPAVLAEDGRVLAMQTALASFLLPWDYLTLGRTIQAAFNGLCIPATFVLGRLAGLDRAAAFAGALLLLAVPEFQESAWRNWPDSQATLLIVLYTASLLAYLRGPRPHWAVLAMLTLAYLFVTKDSAAFTVAPFLLLLGVPAVWHWRRWRAAMMLVGLLLAVAGVLVLATPATVELARLPILGRPLLMASRLPESLSTAWTRVPEQAGRLTDILGAPALSVGFEWAWLLGGTALAARTIGSARPIAWASAAVAWLLTLPIPFLALQRGDGPGGWAAILVACLLPVAAVARRVTEPRTLSPWLVVLLGATVAAFLGQRLVLTSLPGLGAGPALTVRFFFAALPLCAVVGGAGISAFTGWLARHGSGARWETAHAVATLTLAVALVGLGTPLWSRASSSSLLGRAADRGIAPDTPQGLRVAALIQAEDWLRSNLQPTDIILTGIPRQLAWYADLGVEGLHHTVDLGGQPRSQAERRAFIRDRLQASGADYVVDFNVAWTTPDSEDAREWRLTYEWLASRPWLEVAYLRRDPLGRPVFYVVRNHGDARSPSYRDREEARAELGAMTIGR